MTSIKIRSLLSAWLGAFAFTAAISAQADLFTYQGELQNGGVPTTSSCDFQFTLFDAMDSGNLVGAPVELLNQPVMEGIFTVDLDFGVGTFNGDDRWIDIMVRCPTASGNYVLLSPRQMVQATPYALYALNANSPFSFSGDNAIFTGGNVGIGTNSPSKTLHLVNSGPDIGIRLKSAGSWTAELRQTNASLLSLINGGTERLTITPGGRFGFNTISPSAALHVVSDADPVLRLEADSDTGQDTGVAVIGARNATTASDAAYIDLRDYDSDEGPGTEFSMARIGAGMADISGQTGNLRFYTNNGSGLAEQMRITKDGKVGLGQTTPSADLHLFSSGSLQLRMDADSDNNGESDQPSITMTQDGGLIRGSIGYFDANNDLSIRSQNLGGGADILLEPDSYVGMGTNDPQNFLDVRGPGTFIGGDGEPGFQNDTVVARFVQTTEDRGTAISIDDVTENVGGRSALMFARNGVAQHTIWSLGADLIIARSGPDSMDILRLQIQDDTFTGVNPGRDALIDLGNDFDAWRSITTWNFVNKSDIRLKKEIRDLDYGISDIMGLRPVRFNWKVDSIPGEHLGVIAQEVEQVIPEVVTSDANGKSTKSVNYISLIPVLISGMQDQQREIESATEQTQLLMQRLEELEATIAKLTGAGL